jgi:hypothetical protein
MYNIKKAGLSLSLPAEIKLIVFFGGRPIIMADCGFEPC